MKQIHDDVHNYSQTISLFNYHYLFTCASHYKKTHSFYEESDEYTHCTYPVDFDFIAFVSIIPIWQMLAPIIAILANKSRTDSAITAMFGLPVIDS